MCFEIIKWKYCDNYTAIGHITIDGVKKYFIVNARTRTEALRLFINKLNCFNYNV